MAEILHALAIEGTAAKVFEALTQERGLQGWWTRFTRATPEIGQINEFGFNGGAFLFRMRIDELDENRHVKWLCLGGHPEWERTTITFDISPDPNGKGVLLEFAHSGWKRTDGVFAHCSYDWAQYLRSLRMLIEKGKGTPH